MKLIIVAAVALVACVAAAPLEKEVVVPQIIRSDFEQQPQGPYTLFLETDDGTKREEVGEIKEVYDEDKKVHQVIVVRGSYSYINKDGTVETITYGADENGYHADGPSIPKPVEAIARV